MSAAPLILTAAFGAEEQARFDRLREAHFPAERNVIPAHLTLFHHLPGDDLPLVQHVVEALCARTAPCVADVTGVRSLGRGVAFELRCPALLAVRGVLAREWHEHLTAQDRQGWRPHVTVQNKATAEAAAALLAAMRAEFVPFTVRVEGLLLWRYLGGPWEALGRFPFGSAGSLVVGVGC